MRDLPRIVAETPVGRAVPVVVWRDGKEQTLQVRSASCRPRRSRPRPSPTAPATRPTELAGLGLKVGPISPETRERFSLKPEQQRRGDRGGRRPTARRPSGSCGPAT